MAVTVHDVLRAIVRGDRDKLHDPRFVEDAVKAIDADEKASKAGGKSKEASK